MNTTELTAILGRYAQLDPRLEVTDETVEAWHDMIGDLDARDVAAAFKKHHGQTRERIMPADVRRLVNGAPDAGRHARRELEYGASDGITKPEWFDEQAAYWRDRARETGRHCHCPHHERGWANEPYWERNR